MNMIAFMLFHTVSKKAPKALAYTTLVTAWIATEYWYTVGDFSWPWLILGNGFSHEVWAVQWYEYTGVFGGTLWVLLSNILIFEALRARTVRQWTAAACVVAVPVVISLAIWGSWEQPDEGTAEVSIVQPNVDCYDKFHGDTERQEENILDLLNDVPAGAQFILLPETSVPGYYREPALSDFWPGAADTPGAFWQTLTDTLRSRHPEALLIAGTNTTRHYPAGAQTETARAERFGNGYYDVFNTAVGLDSAGRTQIHHKGRLVIGVENTPTWGLRRHAVSRHRPRRRRGTDRPGTARHGFRTRRRHGRARDLLRGALRRFLRRFRAPRRAVHGHHLQRRMVARHAGLQAPVHHLAPEGHRAPPRHRRSANTGRSGFISARGDVGETLGWEERGVISARVPLNSELTIYTRYGDYLARISEYVLLLCVLYYVAYRVKRKNHLVK